MLIPDTYVRIKLLCKLASAVFYVDKIAIRNHIYISYTAQHFWKHYLYVIYLDLRYRSMEINSVLKFHCILDGPCSFTFHQAHERLNNATYPIFMVTPIAVVHCLESSIFKSIHDKGKPEKPHRYVWIRDETFKRLAPSKRLKNIKRLIAQTVEENN